MQLAFGTLFASKIGAQGKLATAIRMLWPHVSKDIGTMDSEQLATLCTFTSGLLAVIVEGGVQFDEKMLMIGQVVKSEDSEPTANAS